MILMKYVRKYATTSDVMILMISQGKIKFSYGRIQAHAPIPAKFRNTGKAPTKIRISYTWSV